MVKPNESLAYPYLGGALRKSWQVNFSPKTKQYKHSNI
jgi:hypothetical protein